MRKGGNYRVRNARDRKTKEKEEMRKCRNAEMQRCGEETQR